MPPRRPNKPNRGFSLPFIGPNRPRARSQNNRPVSRQRMQSPPFREAQQIRQIRQVRQERQPDSRLVSNRAREEVHTKARSLLFDEDPRGNSLRERFETIGRQNQARLASAEQMAVERFIELCKEKPQNQDHWMDLFKKKFQFQGRELDLAMIKSEIIKLIAEGEIKSERDLQFILFGNGLIKNDKSAHVQYKKLKETLFLPNELKDLEIVFWAYKGHQKKA